MLHPEFLLLQPERRKKKEGEETHSQAPPASLIHCSVGPHMRSMKCVKTSKKRSGFETPFTRVVCTPCYRAPEVRRLVVCVTSYVLWSGMGLLLHQMHARVYACTHTHTHTHHFPCCTHTQVVMSHGNYSSALDMWSVGCVFGELIQRVPYLGKSSTPHLQVGHVFSYKDASLEFCMCLTILGCSASSKVLGR